MGISIIDGRETPSIVAFENLSDKVRLARRVRHLAAVLTCARALQGSDDGSDHYTRVALVELSEGLAHELWSDLEDAAVELEENREHAEA